MFDFAWSEIALIGVVALIAIGPKDMPVAIKAISDTVKKLRRMAGEFQGHVDEMIREADLGDVKSSIDELRRINPRAMVQRAIDPDGTVRSAFADPFRDKPVQPVMAPLDQVHVGELASGAPPDPEHAAAPAFIPPVFVPAPFDPPAFIPPGAEPPPFIAPAFIQPAAAYDPPPGPALDAGLPHDVDAAPSVAAAHDAHRPASARDEA